MKAYAPVRTILIRDPRAVAIVNERAKKENRSAANAASQTIIEALSSDNNTPGQLKNQEFISNGKD